MLLITTFYLIWMSRIRQSSPATITPGHIAPGILLRRHSIRMSHIRNSSPPHSTWLSYIRNPVPPPFPSPDVLHFKFSSLGFQVLKITFLIKIGCHFLSGKPFSHLLCFKKCFEISKGSNSVISSDGIYGISSCKNELDFGGGPTYVTSRLIDCLTDSFSMSDWFILFLDMRVIISIHCSLTLFHDSAFVIGGPGMYSLYLLWFSYVHDSSEYSLISLLIAMFAPFY